jgi:hypothetical protein
MKTLYAIALALLPSHIVAWGSATTVVVIAALPVEGESFLCIK